MVKEVKEPNHERSKAMDHFRLSLAEEGRSPPLNFGAKPPCKALDGLFTLCTRDLCLEGREEGLSFVLGTCTEYWRLWWASMGL